MKPKKTLRDSLLGSRRLKRSLTLICDVKEFAVGEDPESHSVTYCYDESKLLGHFFNKWRKLTSALAV